MPASIADMSTRTRLSYACFALALFISLGSYQFISPVKQAIFFDLVGTSVEPLAKSLVLVILAPVLLVYSTAFTYLQDPKMLMLVVGGVFAGMYLFLGITLRISGGNPGAWAAWVLYYLTECRAVILMPMIWSILNDVTQPGLAPLIYPLIFCVIQLGGIAGSFVAVHVSSLGGEVGLLMIQVVVLLAVIALTWCGCVLNKQQEEDPERAPLLPEKPKSRSCAYEAVEGLWLLLSRPYAFMTFWVSYATLTPRTVLDYANGVMVKQTHPERAAQVSFWGNMSLVQNSCTAVLTLIGTRPIVEAVGVGRVLLVLPITMLCCMIAVSVHTGLWVSVVACIVASVTAYGLNSPCKEMLYIRTSREIKYKAKSWSEMYGNELMKLLGAQINLWVNNENNGCIPNCFHPRTTLLIVSIWVLVWVGMAVSVGRRHKQLEDTDEIVS